jgi:hypothetical protein
MPPPEGESLHLSGRFIRIEFPFGLESTFVGTSQFPTIV